MKPHHLLSLGWLLAYGACADADVPDAPTYEAHVKPILDANCVRCHSDPVIGGAPSDAWFDTRDLAEAQVLAITGQVLRGRMPPKDTLEDWQIETIQRWCRTLAEPQFCEVDP